jgi:quercetin dioxygenase-like cupin family protein
VAKPGDVIDLPSLGVRITFLVTSGQTNGNLLRVAVVLPAGFAVAEHVHPQQEERHQVVSGTLRARVGGQEQDYQRDNGSSVPRAFRTHGATPATARLFTSCRSRGRCGTWS